MSQARSPSAGHLYGLARVCTVWRVPRSTVYARRRRARAGPPPPRPTPPGILADADLLAAIREILAATPFVGEGHRKVWARLRHRGIHSARRRVLRVMRTAGLLAPTRLGHAHGPKAHDGTIVTDRPDELWGTDQTGTLTGEGQAAIFFAIDHCTTECKGIHAARRGTRFEALEPMRQGVRETFGAYGPAVAAGLAVRHDHGSQFVSGVYQDELRFLGIRSTPAYVREPEGNGCAERFVRTLKEQLLWLQRFATVEDLRVALQEFKDRYNRQWIVERHGYQTPSAARAALKKAAEAAA